MFFSLYIAIDWIIRVVMIPVVARKRRPYVALSWLALIFLVPWLGVLVYFVFGSYQRRESFKRHRRVREIIQRDQRITAQQEHRLELTSGSSLAHLTERMTTHRWGGFPILDGNAVEVIDQPGTTVDRLIADVEAARGHVHLLFYMYIDDGTGRRVAEALARAASRGVRCRLLVDAYASKKMRATLKPWLKKRGVEVHTILPLHPVRRPLARWDIRNHRKIAIIDGRVGYTGSTNIHDPGHQLEEGVWHQISVRLEGPAVLQLQMVFAEDWYAATEEVLRGSDSFPDPERRGTIPVQTISDGPSYPENIIQHALVEALHEARERITITTPYFIPDDPSGLALRLAALRGVEVDLIIPQRSDRHSVDIAGRGYFESLLDAGVRIHLHPHGLLHAKTVTVDHAFSLIGTANFDRRSFFLNYEVMLLLYGSEVTERLRRSQERFLAEAIPIDPAEWDRRPASRKYIEDTVRLLSPIM